MIFSRAVIGLICMMTLPLWASAELEHLEAIYIQKIINYVEWPESRSEEFVIAVAGQEKLREKLEEIFKTPIAGKSVKIIPYQRKESAAASQILCLFSSKTSIPSHSGVLVITHKQGGIPDGAIINFVLEEGKLRFDINNTEAQRRKIRINARLLKLARTLK